MASHSGCGTDKYFDEITQNCHPCSDCKPPRPEFQVCHQQCANVTVVCQTDYYFDGFLDECRSCTECMPPRPRNQFCSSCPYLSSSTTVSSAVTDNTADPAVNVAVVVVIAVILVFAVIAFFVCVVMCVRRQRRQTTGQENRRENGEREQRSLVPQSNGRTGDCSLIVQPCSSQGDDIALETQCDQQQSPAVCPTGGALFPECGAKLTQPDSGDAGPSIVCPTKTSRDMPSLQMSIMRAP